MRLGFCLPPDKQAQLLDLPGSDPDDFTAALFAAEGLDWSPRDELYRQVRTLVAHALDTDAPTSSD